MSSNADSYTNVLEHAPVLMGADGHWATPGRDGAAFLARAIEPFVLEPTLNREGIIERLTTGTPPALGDGGRALSVEEAERVVHVCELLRIGQSGLNADVQPRAPREPDPREWSGEEGLSRVSSLPEIIVTDEEFPAQATELLEKSQRGYRVLIVGSNDGELVASLIPARIQK